MSYLSIAKRILIISVSAGALFLSGCKKNKHKVDISNIEIDMDLQRYEDDIFNVENLNDFLALDQLDSVFFAIYKNWAIEPAIRLRFGNDTMAHFHSFTEFINNKDMRDLYNACVEKYKDMDPYMDEIQQAFKYHKYHFPDSTIPDIVTHVAPFMYGAMALDKKLCIELDMFLGPDFEPYQTPSLNFPMYVINKFKPDMMVPNAMKAWLMSEFTKEDKDRRFLSEIIYEGKILYLMDAMFPEMHDSLKIGYLNGQLEWNQQNEAQIWNNIIENDLLYSTDEIRYMGLIHDGPFSKGINVPQESSPRVGVWAGWQIIRKYMAKHPDTSLIQLMALNDPDQILKDSGYKP